MKYADALSKLIDERHADAIRIHIPIPDFEEPETRDEVATNRTNIQISTTVMNYLRSMNLYNIAEPVEFDTFDNGREYGLTVSVAGWTFCAYEHRNSDNVIIQGCRNEDVSPVGPYGPDHDKYDYLAEYPWRAEYYAGVHLGKIIDEVRRNPAATRESLSKIKKEEVV